MSQKIKNRKKFEMLIWQKDSLFDSWWLDKFICKCMLQGKKYRIEKALIKAFSILKFEYKTLPYFLFIQVFNKLKPLLGTVSKRVGKKYYVVPIPLRFRRQYIISLNWIVKSTQARQQQNEGFSEKIITEFMDLFSSQRGLVYRKRNDYFKLLTISRIYTHYRWV